ncbi:hypothetical protein BpHYR1_000892 [Brachionus plicatilis]|uniref:Uncharacterized protein n=1 Tax=Brachionus plicatilis TaxID=10195 RepID=A0A3M7SF20_BRAPC|nr:hypothetical protein BpHYR1_000892 [Brachionus plicatilis]
MSKNLIYLYKLIPIVRILANSILGTSGSGFNLNVRGAHELLNTSIIRLKLTFSIVQTGSSISSSNALKQALN